MLQNVASIFIIIIIIPPMVVAPMIVVFQFPQLVVKCCSDDLEDHAFLVFRYCHSEDGDGMFSEAS